MINQSLINRNWFALFFFSFRLKRCFWFICYFSAGLVRFALSKCLEYMKWLSNNVSVNLEPLSAFIYVFNILMTLVESRH